MCAYIATHSAYLPLSHIPQPTRTLSTQPGQQLEESQLIHGLMSTNSTQSNGGLPMLPLTLSPPLIFSLTKTETKAKIMLERKTK